MTRTKQVNSEHGAVLNREFPKRSRSLIIEKDGSECIETEVQK